MLVAMEETDLISALIPAVEQQLDSPETPFVRITLDRLTQDDTTTREEAMQMIALCLADESNRMFIDKRNFDIDRYQSLLNTLPELPTE